MSFLGSLFSSGMASREAAKNREFQERAIKHRYQWQKQDLLKAGYNPALAYGQQPPGGPGGAQAQWNVQGNPVEEAANAAIAISSAQKAKSEADMAKSDAHWRPHLNMQNYYNLGATGALTAITRQGAEIENRVREKEAIVGEAVSDELNKLGTAGQIGYGVLKDVLPTAAGALFNRGKRKN